MLVKELIELLEGHDPDTEVCFTYNYGDYWHTRVAPGVSSVETGTVQYSDYHRMDKVSDTDDEEVRAARRGDGDADTREVILLS